MHLSGYRQKNFKSSSKYLNYNCLFYRKLLLSANQNLRLEEIKNFNLKEYDLFIQRSHRYEMLSLLIERSVCSCTTE